MCELAQRPTRNPTEPIVDAHQHVWRLAHTPWLRGPTVPRIFGEYAPLRRDYSIEEFMNDALPNGVVKSVFVQVNVDPDREVEEVEWVQSLANRCGFPHAITAFADLSSSGVADVLDREVACSNTRAVRQQLHWHENRLYRYADDAFLMNDAAWRRGLREVERRDLMFELQVFAGQMQNAAALASDFPGVTFVLLHAGMPEDRSEQGWVHWRAGMKRLAACPNVAVKISGLGTFERVCLERSWRPVVEQTVDMFGPLRCLFGSNFPIEGLWTRYGTLVDVMRACLSRYTADERRAVLHDTASRLYRI